MTSLSDWFRSVAIGGYLQMEVWGMHTVHYDNRLKVLIITYSGKLTVPDLECGCREGVELLQENNCSCVLIDSREVDLAASTMELFHLAKTFAAVLAEFGIEIREIQRALLVNEITDDYKFIENVAVNNGHKVKVFDDMDQAKQWLSS